MYLPAEAAPVYSYSDSSDETNKIYAHPVVDCSTAA